MEHPVSHNQEIPTESLRRRKSLIWQDLLESQQNRCPVRLTKPGRISNALTDIGRCFVVGTGKSGLRGVWQRTRGTADSKLSHPVQ
jgi:hypothetical protein